MAERKAKEEKEEFLVCTTALPPGYKLTKVLGLVWGSEVKTRGFTANLASVMRSFKGGSVPELDNLVRSARRSSVERMVKNAKRMGATGVIGIRMAGATVRSNMVEFMAYGTAVIVEKA
jgi:uncharacterized protein YbjQ (UPF0145 family)